MDIIPLRFLYKVKDQQFYWKEKRLIRSINFNSVLRDIHPVLMMFLSLPFPSSSHPLFSHVTTRTGLIMPYAALEEGPRHSRKKNDNMFMCLLGRLVVSVKNQGRLYGNRSRSNRKEARHSPRPPFLVVMICRLLVLTTTTQNVSLVNCKTMFQNLSLSNRQPMQCSAVQRQTSAAGHSPSGD